MGRISVSSLRTVSGLALAAALMLAATPAVHAQQADAPAAAAAPAPAATPATGVPAWGIASAELPADTAITFGVLPNGMRYALQPNANPPGEAAIRFMIAVGAKEETDAEHGAAHFVEHMAFNGSTNIPEGQLLPMLERLGLAFGADTNAETSLEYTSYKLTLPRTDAETVDAALKVIRDMASELTLDPAAVERERGVILNEAQVRNDASRRRAADYFEAALPGARLGSRVRADVERIKNISAADLRAFYQAYYRPERATMVIVGNFDVAEMRAKIEATFGNWQAKGAARPRFAAPIPAAAAAPAIASFVDPAIPEIIELQRFSAWTPSTNTVTETREQVLRAVAASALTNRIAALSRSAESPTLGAQAVEQPLFRTARSYGLLIVAKDGKWQKTLALAEQELRRADQFGFTASEIAEAKANFETALSNAAAQAAGRNNSPLAEALIGASLDNSVPTSPAIDLALYRAIAPSLTPEAVSAAFKAGWQGGPSIVHVSTKQPIAGGGEAIAAALSQSAAVAVVAPVEAAAATFAYGEWGTPGTVVSDTTIADLGIRTVTFANGLQLNLKTTTFEPGKVAFSLRVGAGAGSFPQDRAGLREMLPLIFSIDGLAAHDADELRRVLAGKAVGTALAVDESALVASGTTTPADLDLQLDLLAARLTASGWRPETQAQWAGIAPIIVQNIRANPLQLFSVALSPLLAGGDTRLGLTDAAQLAQVSVDDLRAVVAPQLETGPLAIGLVGDFDPDAAIKLVAGSLGALPKRAARREDADKAAPLAFAKDRGTITLTHSGGADQGVLALSWPTDDGDDQKDDTTRDLLAAVMSLRLTEKLREELGATYSPEAFSSSSRRFDRFGFLTAYATVPLPAMDSTAAAIRAIAAELAAQPVAADLLERARNPIREGFQRSETQNAAWTNLVAAAQSDPAVLDRRRSRAAVLDAVTPADIQAAAKRYLGAAAPTELRVVPAAP